MPNDLPTVAEAEARVATARQELRAAEWALRDAIIRHSPVKIGEIYSRQSTHGDGWKKRVTTIRGRVAGFETSYGNTLPVLIAIKKDGKDSVQKIQMHPYFDWVREG